MPTTPPVDETTPDTEPPDDLQTVAEQARQDLADDLGVDVTDVEVVSAEEVVWPDGSIGCPEPGVSYTQATVDGNRILLKAKGASYSYHGILGGVPVVCANPQIPPPIR